MRQSSQCGIHRWLGWDEMINDQTRGIYRKYDVQRLNDPTGKHNECYYFVLDRVHDKHAVPALAAYVESCKEEFPELARDLLFEIEQMKARFADDSPQ